MLKCIDLKCEDLINPIGIDTVKPRFSWKMMSDKNNVFQSGYEIEVEGMWHARVESQESLYIDYDGAPLCPKTEYNYKVRIIDNYGEVSPYICGSFVTGLMGTPISAKWIGKKEETEKISAYVKTFSCHLKEKAYIFASAYGLYEIYINGKRLEDRLFTPGFTSYHKRLQYQMYDISRYICDGENKIEVWLGKGWCCGRYPGDKLSKMYAEVPAFMMFLEADGKKIVETDTSWKCYDSPILFSEFYDGETYDSRIEGIYKNESKVHIFDYGYENLVWNIGSPIKVMEDIKPVKMFKTPKGERVIDFGQNFAGWVQLKVNGNKGDIISFTHAEVLDNDGNFYTKNLRTAKNKVTFILNGSRDQIYHPHFSFQGFRYIRIDECSFDIDIENFIGKVIYSDININGKFHCSNDCLNKLFENIIWSQKGNFIDVPTDCPQRDERIAWTGDAQVFMAAALKNAECNAFFKKWLLDMKADQGSDGCARIFIPLLYDKKTSSAWGDSACICPWEFYKANGDKRFLSQMYPMMKKWVEYIRMQGDNEYLWNTGFHFGDWLGLDSEDGSCEGATDKFYIATAFYYYSVSLTSKAANILGYTEDYNEMLQLSENIKREFLNVYTGADKMPVCKTQTAYALGLYMGLTEDKERAAKELNEMIRQNDNKLKTGFVGTPYLCYALSDSGYIETAYNLLLQEEYPSWLYSVTKGATTIWEHWDGLKPDGSMWNENMNSFNHYAYGSIADWIYSVVCGINTDEKNAGYKYSVIKPKPDKKLKFASAQVYTPYGLLESGWEYTDDGCLKIDIKIPCNTAAKIILPNGYMCEKGSGRYTWKI